MVASVRRGRTSRGGRPSPALQFVFEFGLPARGWGRLRWVVHPTGGTKVGFAPQPGTFGGPGIAAESREAFSGNSRRRSAICCCSGSIFRASSWVRHGGPSAAHFWHDRNHWCSGSSSQSFGHRSDSTCSFPPHHGHEPSRCPSASLIALATIFLIVFRLWIRVFVPITISGCRDFSPCSIDRDSDGSIRSTAAFAISWIFISVVVRRG